MLLVYCEKAVRTMSDKTTLEVAIMGLLGELGEVTECYKKHYGQGKELNREKVLDELGDLLWYSVVVYHITGNKWKLGYVFPNTEKNGFGENYLAIVKPMLRCVNSAVSAVVSACDLDSIDIIGETVKFIELLGFTVQEVIDCNVSKLEKRYPDGFKVMQ